MNKQDKDKRLADRSVGERLSDFSDLLATIDAIDDKKRKLWYEIYENAITDRDIAYSMFLKLSSITGDQSSEHAVHAKSMGMYIERMSRANDQLIKLSDMIATAESKSESVSSEEIYSRLQQ